MCTCGHMTAADYLPCNPNIGDLLTVAVVDQGYAHVL